MSKEKESLSTEIIGIFAREKQKRSKHITWKGEGGVFECIGFTLAFIGLVYLIACISLILQ